MELQQALEEAEIRAKIAAWELQEWKARVEIAELKSQFRRFSRGLGEYKVRKVHPKQKTRKKGIVCYRCRKKGHIARECSERKRRREDSVSKSDRSVTETRDSAEYNWRKRDSDDCVEMVRDDNQFLPKKIQSVAVSVQAEFADESRDELSHEDYPEEGIGELFAIESSEECGDSVGELEDDSSSVTSDECDSFADPLRPDGPTSRIRSLPAIPSSPRGPTCTCKALAAVADRESYHFFQEDGDPYELWVMDLYNPAFRDFKKLS